MTLNKEYITQLYNEIGADTREELGINSLKDFIDYIYDDHLYISMLGQKDIDFYNNSIDYTDLDELYKRAEMEINDKLKQGKN